MIRLAIYSLPLKIFNNGRDPNSIETQTLDIIQLIDDTLPISTTIGPLARIADRRRTISYSESVSDELFAQHVS